MGDPEGQAEQGAAHHEMPEVVSHGHDQQSGYAQQ